MKVRENAGVEASSESLSRTTGVGGSSAEPGKQADGNEASQFREDTTSECGSSGGSAAARLQSLEQAVAGLEDAVRVVARQQDVVQASLRQWSDRVTDAANSLGAPRVRELYLRLLLLYDLVEPSPAHLSADAKEICQVVSGQIEQFLAVAGFRRIATDGEAFDRDRHKPVQVVTGGDRTSAGRVLATVRNGFRSDQSVLRPAEVVIAAECTPTATATGGAVPDCG